MQEVGAKARLNGIAPDDLALLRAAKSGEPLDRALADAVSVAAVAVEAAGETRVKKTAETLAVLKDAAGSS